MVTTAVAFLSLGTASMAVTRDYGIFAAVGVVLAFVFSLVGMAAMIPRAASLRPPAHLSQRVGAIVERVMLFSVRYRAPVAALTVLLAACAVFAAGRIVVDTDSFEFLPDDHPARLEADAIEGAVGPFFPLEMTLRVEQAGWVAAGRISQGPGHGAGGARGGSGARSDDHDRGRAPRRPRGRDR